MQSVKLIDPISPVVLHNAIDKFLIFPSVGLKQDIMPFFDSVMLNYQ